MTQKKENKDMHLHIRKRLPYFFVSKTQKKLKEKNLEYSDSMVKKVANGVRRNDEIEEVLIEVILERESKFKKLEE